MENMKALVGKHIITPNQIIEDGVIIVNDGTVLDIGNKNNISIPEGCELLDFKDNILSPGFIDIHIHGANGHWAQESPEATLNLGSYIAKNGTTSFLPTVQSNAGVKNVVKAKKEQKQKGYEGADIAGIHMEGPFLAPKKLENASYADAHLMAPSIEYLNKCYEDSEGMLKMMGVAIELEGAFDVIKEMRKLNILPAVAHTKSNYGMFQRSVEVGIRHVTHTYNVMTGLHHRRPGIVGGALTNDQVTCELIGDGFHVHPAAMDIVIRCKGVDKIALITDLTIGGLPDGEHGNVIIKDGIARLRGVDQTKDNTMAGSLWPLNSGVRNVVKLGYSLKDAIKMASLTPARIVGIDRTKGSLEVGKDADIIVIDNNVNVYMTMVKGQIVHQL